MKSVDEFLKEHKIKRGKFDEKKQKIIEVVGQCDDIDERTMWAMERKVRSNSIYKVEGRYMSISDMSRESNIQVNVIRGRLARGSSPEDAMKRRNMVFEHKEPTVKLDKFEIAKLDFDSARERFRDYDIISKKIGYMYKVAYTDFSSASRYQVIREIESSDWDRFKETHKGVKIIGIRKN